MNLYTNGHILINEDDFNYLKDNYSSDYTDKFEIFSKTSDIPRGYFRDCRFEGNLIEKIYDALDAESLRRFNLK